MTKKMLLINIIISQAIILIIAFILKELTVNDCNFVDIFKITFGMKALSTLLAGITILLTLQFLFLKYVSKERLFDEINMILLGKFSLLELSVIFLTGAFVEEFLFRGILQSLFGIWVSSFLFTLIHFRYLRKIFILIEVCLMGIILGISYEVTSSLWVPILCHWVVNLSTAILIKKGYIEFKHV